MKQWTKRIVQRFPPVRHLVARLHAVTRDRDTLLTTVEQLQRELEQCQGGWPPGHFYSPFPSITDIKQREHSLFDAAPRTVPGIDLNEAGQLDLLEHLKGHYASQPFKDTKQPHLRYYFDNPNYSYGEAIVLYCMMQVVRPKKIIEIGSGYSSCAILDTNERVFGNAVECVFIEPYPELLFSLIEPDDRERARIIPQKVQDVDLTLFAALAAGDILFIDSSHVSKVGSDVNHIFFEILPRLAPGVYVHFHDVGYPFEYPKEWIYQGRAWNEAYLLRAFLQYNAAFRVAFFNAFLAHFHHGAIAASMPLCMKNMGTSIWLKRLAHQADTPPTPKYPAERS